MESAFTEVVASICLADLFMRYPLLKSPPNPPLVAITPFPSDAHQRRLQEEDNHAAGPLPP